MFGDMDSNFVGGGGWWVKGGAHTETVIHAEVKIYMLAWHSFAMKWLTIEAAQVTMQLLKQQGRS